jgi:hypothetical protein
VLQQNPQPPPPPPPPPAFDFFEEQQLEQQPQQLEQQPQQQRDQPLAFAQVPLAAAAQQAVNALYEAAGIEGGAVPSGSAYLEDVGPILIYDLGHIAVPAIGTGVDPADEYAWEGYHGTSVTGAIAILESGRLLAKSWRAPHLLFVRGGAATNHVWQRAAWIRQTFLSSMGSSGLVFGCECRTREAHSPLPKRNDPLNGHDAELRDSQLGLVTRYSCKPARWTFPEPFVKLTKLYVVPRLLLDAGVESAIAMRGI